MESKARPATRYLLLPPLFSSFIYLNHIIFIVLVFKSNSKGKRGGVGGRR